MRKNAKQKRASIGQLSRAFNNINWKEEFLVCKNFEYLH